MAKRWISQYKHPIIAQMLKSKLGKSDVTNALQVDRSTFDSWLANFLLIPLPKLLVLAGLFGISIEELVYLLFRNKQTVSKEGKWYIEEIRDRYKDK